MRDVIKAYNEAVCETDREAAFHAVERALDRDEPLQWMTVNLGHLEAVIADAIARRQQEAGA